MSARTLLETLRARGFVIVAEGENLTVDAPAGAVTYDLRASLVENKQALLTFLAWERRWLEEADRRGLVIKWAKEPGWIALHDPTTGEWHEVRASECLPGVVDGAKARNRRNIGGA
jgi:hypothetical protein